MRQDTLKGDLLALFTVSIWAGWMIITRLGVKSHLSPFDITFLRFATAGLLFSPLAIRSRREIFRAPKPLLLLMLLGAGAPYVWISAIGFQHAPASHGILIPGTMPLWVALLSFFLFRERFSGGRLVGYAFIFSGILFKLGSSLRTDWGLAGVDAYFLLAAILWAVYTVSNRKAGLSPLAATAWVTSGSAIALAIPYLLYQWKSPHALDLSRAALQIFYQGILTSIVSLITYNKAIEKIGASRSSAFAALVPAMVTFLAYPILGEKPGPQDLIFVACMTLGVALASNLLSKKAEGCAG